MTIGERPVRGGSHRRHRHVGEMLLHDHPLPVASLEERRPGAGRLAEQQLVKLDRFATEKIAATVAELVKEQARHNVAVLQALSRTIDWDGVRP